MKYVANDPILPVVNMYGAVGSWGAQRELCAQAT
jgi:hypothetical protein